jgi:1-deoxy-D-xylulose-5-phosphate reductoisomerase
LTLASEQKTLCILGSTGSIGESTLELVRQHPERFTVQSLSANTNIKALLKQCLEFNPQQVVVVDEKAAQEFSKLAEQSEALSSLEILQGAAALEQIAASSNNDTVMASIVGAAGLPASLAAAKAGKRILLANKEALVMAGSLFMKEVSKHGATLLPIDSEHNAVFQCLSELHERDKSLDKAFDVSSFERIRRVTLTASGGPFLNKSSGELENVSPDEACKHPRWEMGRKISVDSATLMNKGLEVIEACLLFNLPREQVEVIIHPQSVVHSMVEYVDGSVLAQMANPDMKIPIAYGLSWPERITTGVAFLDLLKDNKLEFQEPDLGRFPCLALAYRALGEGPSAVTALNAANEEAVQAFLAEQIGFLEIPKVITKVLNEIPLREIKSLEAVFEIDKKARALALEKINESINELRNA